MFQGYFPLQLPSTEAENGKKRIYENNEIKRNIHAMRPEYNMRC